MVFLCQFKIIWALLVLRMAQLVMFLSIPNLPMEAPRWSEHILKSFSRTQQFIVAHQYHTLGTLLGNFHQSILLNKVIKFIWTIVFLVKCLKSAPQKPAIPHVLFHTILTGSARLMKLGTILSNEMQVIYLKFGWKTTSLSKVIVL